ncbi:MAG: DUF5050 domain-containing protein [Huintestinicola sp.]|uniref:zinc ribbon domain-containing protein n=1 Tax=Huintestinicola sp. TaxID=2981661 RepID=UPI003F01202B
MICPECGFENKENSKFCLKCGTKLISDGQQTAKPENTTAETVSFSAPSEPVKAKAGSKKIIIGAAAAAVLIVAGAIFIPSPGGLSDNKIDVSEQTDNPTETEASVSENAVITTAATQTSAEAQTSKQVTTTAVKTETATEPLTEAVTEAAEPLVFDFPKGRAVFETNTEYYKWDEHYSTYSYFIPYIEISGNKSASDKINQALSDYSYGDISDQIEMYDLKRIDFKPTWSFGDTESTRTVENVYFENDLLFVSIEYYDDMGGGTSSSIFGSVSTYIFDVSSGRELSFSDLITDKEGFFDTVDAYMKGIVYDNTNALFGDEKYILSPDMDRSYFEEQIEENPWLETNSWKYDGNSLTVSYFYLLGNGYMYKYTDFVIPKATWSSFVDISPNAATDNAKKDISGNKIMSGNTAGNYANYSSYCFDGNDIYFAGGMDGYHWQLKKAEFEMFTYYYYDLSDDMTDMVMADGDTVYYRNASDEYKLYSIKKDGTGRRKITDCKASGVRVYDGHIYFTSEDMLYRTEPDGSGKKLILNKKCLDLQIYNDRIYRTSDDKSQIEYYDMDGRYLGAFAPRISGGIKRFFVSEGYCVAMGEKDLSLTDIVSFNETVYHSDKYIGINENRNYFIVAAMENNYECVYRIPKNHIDEYDFYQYLSGFNDREFYIIYDKSTSYLIAFDKDGISSYFILS